MDVDGESIRGQPGDYLGARNCNGEPLVGPPARRYRTMGRRAEASILMTITSNVTTLREPWLTATLPKSKLCAKTLRIIGHKF